MKGFTLLALLFCLGSAGLRAADFWKERDYKQWKPKEAQKMLTKSPWAQNVSLDPTRMKLVEFENIEGDPTQDSAARSDPNQPRGGNVEALTVDPNYVPVRAAPNLVGPGYNRDGGMANRPPSVGGGPGPPSINVTVRWASALPVKQAIVRSRYLGDFQESGKDEQLLNVKDEQYVVLLSGLPGRMARSLQRNTDRIKQATVLHRRKKDPIAAASVEVLPRDQFLEIFLIFPRTEAIALEDKTVELRTQVGPFKIKRKFKLKKMVFNDKLEL